jgi:uncharacterized membrane protein YfcA
LFLATYAVYMLFRPALARLREKPGALGDASIGFGGGVIGGLTAMPGALPTIWCDLSGIAKDAQRGLLQPYIAAMQVAALLLLFAVQGVPQNLVAASPALVAGGAIGLALYGRVNDRMFRRAVLCALLASGIGFLGYR